MNFWKSIKDVLVLRRKEDEALHAQVLHEIEQGIRRNGLWAKALASVGGNEDRAKAEYISLVVQDLRDLRYVESRLKDEILAELKDSEANQGSVIEQTSSNMALPSSHQKSEVKEQSGYYNGGGPNLLEAVHRSNANAAKARKVEIIALIEAIESSENTLPLKEKLKVIEMAGGFVRWNDSLDPSKGCNIAFEGLERVFENADSVEKWIHHVAVRRIQDYLRT